MSMFDKRSAPDPKGTPVPAQAPRPQQPSPAVKPKPQTNAVIGPGISVSGEITGTENLRIEGQVDGIINLRDNVVSVSRSGEVRANITASTVNISGRVVGDIAGVEQVALSKSAWVRGNIIAPRVNLENGSKFKGSIDMDPIEEKGAQKPKASKQPSPAQAGAPVAAASAKAEDAPVKRATPRPRESAARP